MNNNHNNTMSKSTNMFEEPNGVVGLGIVAAMNEEGSQDPIFSKKKAAIFAVSPRSSSNPISIFGQKNGFVKKRPSIEEMEMCEEYTCVISHVGNEKREYFDDDLVSVSEGCGKKFSVATGRSDGGGGGGGGWMSSGVVGGASSMANHGGGGGDGDGYWVSSGMVAGGSSMANHGGGGGGGDGAEYLTADFLNSCFLCKKKLDGLDIFMYRGETAFCSAECRDKQISVDEHKEKRVSGMMKPSEYSVSPCSSSPMQFSTGVVAS